jgi:hypothetical protein
MVTWIDESSFTLYENYFLSMHSFLSAYSGTLLTTSINTIDSLSLTYLLQHDEKTRLFKYDYKEHIKMIKYTDEEKSIKYKNEAENYKRMMGENSTAFKVNYSLDTDGMLEGKFINLDILRNNNLMKSDLEEIMDYKKDKFISIGIDLGLGGSGDRTIEVVIETTPLDNGLFYHEVKNIVPYTYEKDEHLDQAKLYTKTKNLAINCKADFISMDGTGMQKQIVEGLSSYLKAEGIKSQVVPCDFSNTKKIEMYKYLEGCMYSQRMVFPKEELARYDLGWGLMLKEMLALLKFKKTGKNYYTYENPKGENNHDDTMSALIIGVTSVPNILMSQMERKEIRLGQHSFIPKLQKANWYEQKKENDTYFPTSWWEIK